MVSAVGFLLGEARQLLNDTTPISGVPRFSDDQLVNALNDALQQARAKRPDAFLSFGLRNPVPGYVMPQDANTNICIDDMFYPALLFYVVGRSELIEDTFADNGRAITMMNKFTAQLLKAAS